MKYLLLIAIAFAFAACTKQSLNIWLKDKPLETIKANIKGDWQIDKMFVWGNTIVVKEFSIVRFGKNDEVYWRRGDVVKVNGTIQWVRDIDLANNSTFLMRFIDKNGAYQPLMGVEGIVNGKLILYDDVVDGAGYQLSRKLF